MSDLERRVRDALEGEARSAPPPHDTPPSLRRTRRRQVRTLVSGALGTVAVVATVVVGVQAIVTTDERVPAGPATTMTTINGISITHPEGWYVFDPDEEGLNGPTDGPANVRPGLPRLVLAVYPSDLGELFACPGMVEGTQPTFLMTVQQQPLALAGGGTAPWPVELAPLSFESGGADGVASVESGCYPGWEILDAGWTTGGRTFQARVGLAPDVSDEDREGMLDAFASMTFEPASEPAASVVVATGTAGGEEWELIAERQIDGLSLSLEGATFGTGTGGFDPDSTELWLTSHVFGQGGDAELVVFGAVPAGAVRVGIHQEPDDELLVDVIDVPDEIDERLNAFLLSLPPDATGTVNAYDATGDVIATAELTGREAIEPSTSPTPAWPTEVQPEHGGTYWGAYLAVGDAPDDPEMRTAFRGAQELGYTPSIGDIACDQDAATALGVDPGASRVAVYFDTRREAEIALENAAAALPLSPVGVARVTTYCLD